jgi:Domain of unknown function (DUF4062)
MVSSTGELSQHRQYLHDQLSGTQGFKVRIQDLHSGSARSPIALSLKWIDEADLIIFLLGRTYGSIVPGDDRSYCEAEWDEAQRLGKPCLVFPIADEHEISAYVVDAVEKDRETRPRQMRFREKVERTVTRAHRGFKNAADLGSMAITAILDHFQQLEESTSIPNYRGASFLPPEPPAPYIPHVYTLSAGRFVGRSNEISLLNSWATTGTDPVFALIGLGGMGKTALAWHWVREECPKLSKPFDGILWWSFYEENAGYDDFLAHALAYCTSRTPEAMLQQSVDAKLRELVATLNSRRFLLCLDGLERIMYGYRNFDVAQAAADADIENSGSGVADQDLDALFVGHDERMMEGQRHRRAIDRAQTFLEQICGLERSRILITTRLRPADLELPDRQFRSGVSSYAQMRLNDIDALALIRSLGVTGSSSAMLRIANSIDNHALTLRVLVGEIKNNRRAGGHLDTWLRGKTSFDPTKLQLVQRKTHILQIALRGLSANQVAALASMAAFRGPATFDDLSRILVDYGGVVENEDELARLLEQLEGRLLVGHDQNTGAYDMHPIIRGLTWRGIGNKAREYIASLHGEHFGGLRVSEDRPERNLFVLQQMFFSLVELGRYNEAHELITGEMEDLVIKGGKVLEITQMLDALIAPGDARDKLLVTEGRVASLFHDLGFCHSHSKRLIEAFCYDARVVLVQGAHRRPATANVVDLRNVIISMIGLGRVWDAARLWGGWNAKVRGRTGADLVHVHEVEGLLCLARGEHEEGVQKLIKFVGCVRDDWPSSWLATACTGALAAAKCMERLACGFAGASAENMTNAALRIATRHDLANERSIAEIGRIKHEALVSGAKDIAIASLQRQIELARLRRLIQPEISGLNALVEVAIQAKALEPAGIAARDLAELDALHDDIQLQAESWLTIARYHIANDDQGAARAAAYRVLGLATDPLGHSSFVDLNRDAEAILMHLPMSAVEQRPPEPRADNVVQQLIDRLSVT